MDREHLQATCPHSFERIGSHKIGDVPQYWTNDMSNVPHGTITYDEYRCIVCGAKRSEERLYSWREQTKQT